MTLSGLSTPEGHAVEAISVEFGDIAGIWQATVWTAGSNFHSRHNGDTARGAFEAALRFLGETRRPPLPPPPFKTDMRPIP